MRSRVSTILILALVLVVGAACSQLSKAAPSDFPVITIFAADATSIKTGTAVTLRWDVGDPDAAVRIDPHVGNVPVVGSVAVVLTATTTFTLNARATSGASAQRILTVIVTP